MDTLTSRARWRLRGMVSGLLFVMAVAALGPSAMIGADASPPPASVASPAATSSPSESACASIDDLRLIAEFLRGTDVAEDGWLPVAIGVIAGLSEARQLADGLGDALDETYRPLVEDLIADLQTLGTTVGELRDAGTIGSGIAAVGVAITDVGNSIDALSAQLRTPCPTPAPAAG